MADYCCLFAWIVEEIMNQNKYMLGSTKIQCKTDVLSQNSWSLGKIIIVSVPFCTLKVYTIYFRV